MTNPFDHAPDEQLGRLLRTGLAADGHEAFVHRTRALVALEPHGSSWDVLGAWFRPGLAAAVVVALALSMWLRMGTPAASQGSLAEAVRSVGVPGALISASPASSTDNLLAAVVEGR